MVRALTPQTSFTPEQVATRNAIGARLQGGFQVPMAIQRCSLTFCTPPGLLTIANAETQLPQWLISDYQELYSRLRRHRIHLLLPLNNSLQVSRQPLLLSQILASFPNLQELVGNEFN